MIKKKKFDWNTLIRNIAVIAIPVALQNLLTTTGSMVDTMMIAPLGETSVGAIGLCAQFTSLMFSCYWGFVGGGMLFFAQCYGAKDDDGINRAYGMTVGCMMLVAFTFGLLALLAPSAIMHLYTDKTAIQEIGIRYLKVIGFAYPLQVFSMAMAALLRSTDRVRIPLFGAICSVATNIFLNWVLIYGNLGAPALGIPGAALATTIAAAVNVIVIIVLAAISKHPYLLNFRHHFRLNKEALKQYFAKCAPIICNELLIGIGAMGMNMILGRQSEQAIAATAVFRTLEGFVIGFFAGFSNASSVLVGTQVGAGNLETAYERAKRIVFLCGTCILVACLFLIAVHKPLLTTMSLTGESYRICFGMLLIYSVAAVIRMCNWTQNDTFRSAGDSSFGTILEITFMYIMVLPAVFLSGMKLHLPFLLIFACCYIDEPIRLILMLHHLHSGKWIKPVTKEGQDALITFRKSHHLTKQ